MKRKLLIQNSSLWIFTITYILAMFLPRLLQKGLFMDGLCYSSIARNMAIGVGSFWKPYFSSSFWLPYNTGPVFYEHLPLQFGIQSLFFRLLGDHWYVEKIYSLVALALTLWLMIKIWDVVFDSQLNKSRAWLPILLFYFFPEIIWGAPNNMLENTMSVFILVAVYFFVRALFQNKHKTMFVVAAGFAIFLSFLTKGPVGLFPLVIPIIHFLVFKKYNLIKTTYYTILPIIVFVVAAFVLMLNNSAYEFISTFLNQQLFSALNGTREQANDALGHFYILKWLSIELLPILGITIIVLITGMIVKRNHKVDTANINIAIFFLLIGLAGSLPITISPKQMAIYYIPSLPYFSLAFAAFMLPTINYFFTKTQMSSKKTKAMNRILYFLFIVVILYTARITGQPGREQKLHHEMELIAEVVPTDSKVGVCPEMMTDGYLHGYLQRYYRIELTENINFTKYFVVNNECSDGFDSFLLHNGFKPQNIPTLDDFRVFKKQ